MPHWTILPPCVAAARQHRKPSFTQLPSTIIFAFFKVHIFIFIFWQTYKLYNSAEGHCGYEFPWSPTRVLPLIYGARYHDFHHSKNVGNYATSFYLIELLWGTNKVFFDRELAELKDTAKH